ncbi:MAG TPA: neutral zinc metallopeptidase [Xanthobacteraceae bacterium]|nr:neutral zinc metallopeptidase [Xanthobacteraceae bacterium]
MRYDDFRRSDDIEDRREDGGGGMSLPGGPGGLGIGTVVVLGLLGWALGIDPRLLIGGAELLSGGGSSYHQPYQPPRGRTAAPKDEAGDFVAAVLGENQDRWREIFTKYNRSYRRPRLVLFAGATVSGCGQAVSAMGPFYCPRDERIYLDTSFFREIETRFRGCQSKSACRFSQAYVIGHEFGHHVQNLLGILPKVQEMQRGLDRVEANRLQVRVELQADCFAGLWANHERSYLQSQRKPDFLEPGDVDAALQTASAIGDDTLQKRARGHVVPDAFTHGSAEQRKRWFLKGFQHGTIEACNTFSPSARL